MAEKKGSGCFIAVILMVILAGAGIFGLISLFYMRVSHEVVQATETAAAEGPVIFQEGAFPRFPPHKPGEELPREQFAALMIDNQATDLARKALQDSANDALVSWLLYTEDITERNGTLEGRFTIPYEIRDGRSMHGSSISVRCEFTNDDRDNLLRIRRGDWTVIEGKLSFDGQKATIKEARVADESAAPLAEQP